MCGCEHHWDTNAPCTCNCPDHEGVRREMADRETKSEATMAALPDPPPPTTFRYSSWSGSKVAITAHWVEFVPGFVVFRDHVGRIVHAEDHANVHRLSENGADGEVTGR